MLRFVVGVDKRLHIGADIERMLRPMYDLADFEIIGLDCGMKVNTKARVHAEAECILEALCEREARLIVAVSCGTAQVATPCAIVPEPYTVAIGITPDGEVVGELTADTAYYLPWRLRKDGYTPIIPDLLDLLQQFIVEMAEATAPRIRV